MNPLLLFVGTDWARSLELRAEKMSVDIYQSVGRTPYLSSRMSFLVLLVDTDETRSVGLMAKKPRYMYINMLVLI